MILNAANVHFAYCPSRAVLRGVSLEVHPGRVTALFGPNGCGKSTLLRCMNGALRPQSGQITLYGRQIDTMQLGEIARQIAVVPQDTPADMPFSVAEMVLLGRYGRGNLWGDVSPEDRKVVSQCLERVDALDLAVAPSRNSAAASGSASSSPAPLPSKARCCCSTSRRRTSTLPINWSCTDLCGNWPAKGTPSSWSATTF